MSVWLVLVGNNGASRSICTSVSLMMHRRRGLIVIADRVGIPMSSVCVSHGSNNKWMGYREQDEENGKDFKSFRFINGSLDR